MSSALVLCVLAIPLLDDCLGGDDPPPPPPPPDIVQNPPPVTPTPVNPVGVNPTPVNPTPVNPTPTAGTELIAVTATSVPPGAAVTGGGRALGTTPFTTQVPIPVTAAGQPPPTFDFVFTKDGYNALTLQGSPSNGQIVLSANLTPLGTTPVEPVQIPTPGGSNVIDVVGTGGGAIPDMGRASARATVDQACTISSMSVTVRGRHTFFRDLTIALRSPTGQTYTLQSSRDSNPFRTYNVRRARGKQAQGEWTLVVSDRLQQDMGQLTGFSIHIECGG
jgi:hypothetical protein